jgi:hypothetical protein
MNHSHTSLIDWIVGSGAMGHGVALGRSPARPPAQPSRWVTTRHLLSHQQNCRRLDMRSLVKSAIKIDKARLPKGEGDMTGSKTFRSQLCTERRGTRTPTCQLGYGGFWCSYEVLGNYEPPFLSLQQPPRALLTSTCKLQITSILVPTRQTQLFAVFIEKLKGLHPSIRQARIPIRLIQCLTEASVIRTCFPARTPRLFSCLIARAF